MKFELRNANFSWPKWQAVIMTFFAPWLLMNFHFGKQFLHHIFHVAKKVEVTNILDHISGYSLKYAPHLILSIFVGSGSVVIF